MHLRKFRWQCELFRCVGLYTNIRSPAISIQHHRGSKTIQALDGIYDLSNEVGKQPSGFVVANELDSKRAYVLAHRSRNTLQERMASMAIVTHNACKFPDALAACRRSELDVNRADGTKRERVFDRIICDVPCSGDGTLRKDFKVWSESFVHLS